MYPKLQLKAGRERSLKVRHPWVFSQALSRRPEDVEHGAPVHLCDSGGHIVATGTYSAKGNIAVRVFAFEEKIIDAAWWRDTLRRGCDFRQVLGYGAESDTTGYRLIFGEADGIPGVVIDRYEDVMVFQLATAGADRFRELLIEILLDLFCPRAIIERSDLLSRREEGLDDVVAVRFGADPGTVEFRENGLRFLADPIKGQKTGFYLDQKDLRREIGKGAAEKKVLNLFAYTGANAVAALKGGAGTVHNVDSSETALGLAAAQLSRNDLALERVTVEAADIFQWLSPRREPEFDMVIIDPPALIKTQKDVEAGRKAYHFLNRAALRLVRDGGIFITSSCSAYFPEPELMMTLRKASVQANVNLTMLKTIRQSPDHPISLYFPESFYLKSIVAQVRR